MELEQEVCPVCTLYLRPGITLKEHLDSHPKQKVIEALVRLSNNDTTKEQNQKDPQEANLQTTTMTNLASPVNASNFTSQTFVPGNFQNLTNFASGNFSNGTLPSVNHSIIYQQFMSSSGQNMVNLNPLNQQYITVPTVFNPQMMCSPYVYQQQQVIMSSGPSTIIHRPLSIEMPEVNNGASIQLLSPKTDDEDTKLEDDTLHQIQVGESKVIEVKDDEVEKKEDLSKEELEVINDKEQEIILDLEQNSQGHSESYCEENVSTGDNNQLYCQEKPINTLTEEYRENTLELDQKEEECQCEEKGDFMQEDQCIYGNESKCVIDGSNLIQDSREFFQGEHRIRTVNTNEESFSEDVVLIDISNDMNSKDLSGTSYQSKVESNECFTEMHTTFNTMNVTPGLFNVSTDMVHINSDSATKACQTTSTLNEPNQNNCLQYNDDENDVKDINFIEMDGMKLVLANDFIANQVISQVDDYESIDRSRVLMTIGGMEDINNKDDDHHLEHDPLDTESNDRDSILATDEEDMLLREDEVLTRESLSTESANIRTDERMPARGELSGQEESNECTDDMIWCKMQYNHENSREPWEQMDQSCSDGEVLAASTSSRPTNFDVHQSDFQQQQSSSIRNNFSGDDAINVSDITNGQDAILENYSDIRKTELEEVIQPTDKNKNKNIVFTKRTKTSTTTTEKRIKKEEKETNFDMFSSECGVKEDKDIEFTDTKMQKDSCQLLCTICSALLPSIKQLKEHKQVVHKEGCKYKCNVCNMIFQSEPQYTSHLQIHPLECKLCGKFFYRKQGLELHLKRHLGIKPFKCDICAKSFLTKQKREEHRNVHTGAAPIKCNLCDETFRRYSNLIQHRNRHHLHIKRKLKDFVCHCGEIFHSVKKLAWHKEIHDSKPKACTYCSEKFLHMSSLTRHVRRAHNENFMSNDDSSKKNVECPICKGVYLKTSLEMHIRSHSGEKPYKCSICNKSFTTKWNLKLHKWTHAARTMKPFKCEQCNGAFIRETDYTAHMNSHKSVKPYTCNYCGAQFIRKYNCQRHVREHEKDKTYVCEVCNKEFHRSYYLKDHMRIHTGIRPYSCTICGKTSTTKSNHNKHVRIHHAREPVSTEN